VVNECVGRCKRCGQILFLDDWGFHYAIAARLRKYGCTMMRKHKPKKGAKNQDARTPQMDN
jgi:hypothetical protein